MNNIPTPLPVARNADHTILDSHGLFTNTEAADKAQQEAEALHLSLQSINDEKNHATDDLSLLSPSEQRTALENFAIPRIRELTFKHSQTCADVEHYDRQSTISKINHQNSFAITGMHPDVKLLPCAGDTHFNSILSTGQIPQGYKLWQRRPANLVLIPVEVNNILEYATSPEAIAYAEAQQTLDRDVLVNKRNHAAIQLSEFKKDIAKRLKQIPTLEAYLK
ncbi:hypothetical protein [Erwinia sp.]|uniref:hypothetical protein n=1 Tax=Erwinia citreus TaxID=558 RepID=UPI003C75B796